MLAGLLIAIVGEMVLALIYLVNLYALPGVPWGVVPAGLFMALFWRRLAGTGRPEEEARRRRAMLRAGRLASRAWPWALAATAAALVGLRSLAAAVPGASVLPELPLARLGDHDLTLWAIFVTNYLLFAPLIEEAAFRGYMQVPIEAGCRPWVAVGGVAAVFTLLHAGRGTPLLHFALALFLGVLAYRAGTIWPGVVAHAAVNLQALFPGWAPPLERWIAGGGSPGDRAAGAGLVALASTLVCAAALHRLGVVAARSRSVA